MKKYSDLNLIRLYKIPNQLYSKKKLIFINIACTFFLDEYLKIKRHNIGLYGNAPFRSFKLFIIFFCYGNDDGKIIVKKNKSIF